VEAQRADPQSLLNFYRHVLALRNAHPALTQGRWLGGVAAGPVLAFRRGVEGSGEQALVLINYGTEARSIALPALGSEVQALPLWRSAAGGRGEATESAVWSPTGQVLAPQSVQVWKLVSRPGLRSAHAR
jgi:glycosidase